MSISPTGAIPSSRDLLAAVEMQYAIAAKTLQTANTNAQAVLKLLADAVAFSEEFAVGGAADQSGAQIDEFA
jgi:hypothetical protein